MQDYIKLHELNRKIKEGLYSIFPNSIWIVAEISEIRQNYSGHCYMELIEKDELTQQIIAKSRATIWASNWRQIKPFFELTTGEPLKAEQKILANVIVNFHELYGLSINITAIDPNYTLGDIARKKKEIIDKLIADGVFEMNKDIPFPSLPQRIAIISSKTAAGYSDFMKHLHGSSYQFRFETELFQAIMQGEQAISSILNSMDQVFDHIDKFDLLVIIRGGGSKAELSTFDDYDLASTIAQFPIPVLTGIGHERDESISDMVAFHAFKTPTAVAEFLNSKIKSHWENLLYLEEEIIENIRYKLERERNRLIRISDRFVPLIKSELQQKNNSLHRYKEKALIYSKQFVRNESQKIIDIRSRLFHRSNMNQTVQNMKLKAYIQRMRSSTAQIIPAKNYELRKFQQHLELIKPENLLKRGYSIIYQDGKIIKRAAEVDPGSIITTNFIDGLVEAKTQNVKLYKKKSST